MAPSDPRCVELHALPTAYRAAPAHADYPARVPTPHAAVDDALFWLEHGSNWGLAASVCTTADTDLFEHAHWQRTALSRRFGKIATLLTHTRLSGQPQPMIEEARAALEALRALIGPGSFDTPDSRQQLITRMNAALASQWPQDREHAQ